MNNTGTKLVVARNGESVSKFNIIPDGTSHVTPHLSYSRFTLLLVSK